MEQLLAGLMSWEQALPYQQWMAAAHAKLQAEGIGNVYLLQASGGGFWAGAQGAG